MSTTTTKQKTRKKIQVLGSFLGLVGYFLWRGGCFRAWITCSLRILSAGMRRRTVGCLSGSGAGDPEEGRRERVGKFTRREAGAFYQILGDLAVAISPGCESVRSLPEAALLLED